MDWVSEPRPCMEVGPTISSRYLSTSHTWVIGALGLRGTCLRLSPKPHSTGPFWAPLEVVNPQESDPTLFQTGAPPMSSGTHRKNSTTELDLNDIYLGDNTESLFVVLMKGVRNSSTFRNCLPWESLPGAKAPDVLAPGVTQALQLLHNVKVAVNGGVN